MPRPCGCDRPGCRLCLLYREDPTYRQLWDGPSRSLPMADGPCRHLGGDTGGRQRCGSCQGNVSLKVHHCRHPDHAEQPFTTLVACRSCPDHEPAAPKEGGA